MKNTKVPVFIDTDLDFDDYTAILYLLNHPQVEVLGISITGCGVVFLSKGLAYAKKLLELLNKQNIPIFSGFNTPMLNSNVFPYVLRQEGNAAYYNLELQSAEPYTNAESVITGFERILANSNDKVRVILLGGGTTLGRYIEDSSKHLDKIEQVIFSGGSILSEYVCNDHGNVDVKNTKVAYPSSSNIKVASLPYPSFYNNDVAEYNVFVDSKSVQVILDSNIHMNWVPLNTTVEGIKNSDSLRKSLQQMSYKSRSAAIVFNALHVKRVKDNFLGPIFDLTVAVTAVNPDFIESTRELSIKIEQKFNAEQDTQGKLIVDEVMGKKTTMITKINVEKASDSFLTVMSNSV